MHPRQTIHGLALHEGLATGVIHLLSLGAASDQPIILTADTLTPMDLLQFSKENLFGLLTKEGTKSDHVAAIAQCMGIPWVTAVNIERDWHDQPAILCGNDGSVLLHPNAQDIAHAQRRLAWYQGEKEKLKAFANLPSVMRNGETVQLLATVHELSEASDLLSNGADGIGLFRSEFLFLQSTTLPDEELQYWAYRTLISRMDGKPVTIRTLDIGVDKPILGLDLPREENPALGCRGIRLCLQHPELFKPQLRALLRAAAHSPMNVCYPMISSLDELLACRKLIEICKNELREEGIPYADFAQGVMIETPAAVMISDDLCKHCDFLCIGSSDLMQYTLAADRMNQKTSLLLSPMHPAILQMLRIVIASAKKHDIPLSLCGEIASNQKMLPTLIALGIRRFSLPNAKILAFRAAISQI